MLDVFAYSNRWRHRHPAEKGLLCALALTAALCARAPSAAALTGLLLAALTVAGAGIPLRRYLRLLLLPAGFLLAGTAGLAVTTAGGDLPLFTLPGAEVGIGLTHAGLQHAVLALARALAALTAVYFLVLTTPMTEILGLLRRLRLPALLLELMVLAYRQIHVFAEVARQMRIAQASRLGDASFASRWRSLSILAAGLWVKAHLRSRQLHRALLCRGYDHELNWLEEEHPRSPGALLLAALLGGGLLALALWLPA